MSNLQPPDNDDKNNISRPQTNVTLVCDKCGAENWNLASEGKNHDQQANEVKGYDACDGVWRFPRDLDADRQPCKIILFPARQKDRVKR